MFTDVLSAPDDVSHLPPCHKKALPWPLQSATPAVAYSSTPQLTSASASSNDVANVRLVFLVRLRAAMAKSAIL